MELSVSVIYARVDKVCQHVVDIGRADESTDGKPHSLCEICRKNIAEIACRNANVNLVAERYVSRIHKVAVCAEIVYYLRRKSAPVYGVRA